MKKVKNRQLRNAERERESQANLTSSAQPAVRSGKLIVDQGVDVPAVRLLRFAEYNCWFVLVLVPFLYWINGPAVSAEQLIVRSVLIGGAVAAGTALRIANSAIMRAASHRQK